MSVLSLFGLRRTSSAVRKPIPWRPQVEALEDRRLLAGNNDDLPLPGPWVSLEGSTWSGQVANWHYSNNALNYRSPSEFEATINWGDQTTSTGTVVYQDNTPGRGFLVQGEHVFRRWSDDQYDVEVTIRDKNPPPHENPVIHGRVGIYVAGQRPTVVAEPINAPAANVPWTGKVATVTLPNADRIDSPLTGRVWWGIEGTSPEDGQAVTMRRTGGNQYDVIATHTFQPNLGSGENGRFYYQLIVDATTGQYNRGGRSEVVTISVPVPPISVPVPPSLPAQPARPAPVFAPVPAPVCEVRPGPLRWVRLLADEAANALPGKASSLQRLNGFLDEYAAITRDSAAQPHAGLINFVPAPVRNGFLLWNANQGFQNLARRIPNYASMSPSDQGRLLAQMVALGRTFRGSLACRGVFRAVLAAKSIGGKKKIQSPDNKGRQYAQGWGRYIDPLTNRVVQARPGQGMEADHFIPKNYIEKMFKEMDPTGKLTDAQKSEVLNWNKNFQPLPRSYNASKNGKMPGEWTHFKGKPLHPKYIAKNRELQDIALKQVRDKIQGYLQTP